jgi:hypothetical protein
MQSMGSETLTMTRDDLRVAIVELVKEQTAKSSPALLAETEIDRDRALETTRRVKFWAGFIVAAVTTAATGVTWVYSRGAQDAAVQQHEVTQDEHIRQNSQAAAANAVASVGRDEKIKNLGALQIEQGNDQRAILIKSAPKSVREEMAEKPDTLKAAEGRVLRD